MAPVTGVGRRRRRRIRLKYNTTTVPKWDLFNPVLQNSRKGAYARQITLI